MKKMIIIFFLAVTLCQLWALDGEQGQGNTGFTDTYIYARELNNNILSGRSTMLQDHFGVYPTLIDNSGGNVGESVFSFNWNSLVPTNNTATVTWVESDFYGKDDGSVVHHGTHSSGGERYDVEALYFNNDDDYFYLAVITSVPHLRDYGNGNIGVGVLDTRYSNVWVRPGDIVLDLGLGSARAERNSTSWSYNYGLDITHENRDQTTAYGNFPSTDMRDNLLGSELYRTFSDAGGSDVKNPAAQTSDWHTSLRNGSTQAFWEHTNFDPFSMSKTAGISLAGDSGDGIEVAYYNLAFPGGNLENGQETYVIEAKIPRILFGADNPVPGDQVGFRYTPGCRNDGNSNVAIVKLVTEVQGYAKLGDKVWRDFDPNGIQDPGEPGIDGISVKLYDYNGGTPILVDSKITDASGNYLFTGLLPATYLVEFLTPGLTITTPNFGSDDFDSDADPNTGKTGLYTLAAGAEELSVDCGVISDDPLPVTLSSFNALMQNGSANLSWVTQSESNNALWNVYRALSANSGQAEKINVQSIPGAGTTASPTSYSYYDYQLEEFIETEQLIEPVLYYWLESVDYNGAVELFGPVFVQAIGFVEELEAPEIIENYGLDQNYPNPFNPDTVISFSVSTESKATLKIYNVKGELVKTLFQNMFLVEDRRYREVWNGKDGKGNSVSSGVYLALLKTDNEVFTKKMILQK